MSQLAFTGTDQAALAEWFVVTIAIVVVVTLLYVLVLNKAPPPPGVTVAKLEQQQATTEAPDGSAILSQAHSALLGGDYANALYIACRSVSATLGGLLRNRGIRSEGMNVADLAYLVQSKASSAPLISEPCYHLNSLRLKAAQGQPITQQEAEWAVSIASWMIQAVQNQQIVL